MANQDQFQGDMSRNEVEIDLNKFMSMVSEIGELKDVVVYYRKVTTEPLNTDK